MAIKKNLTDKEWEEAKRKDQEWEANKITKICENCGEDWETVRYDDPYCSTQCEEEAKRKVDRKAKFKQMNGTGRLSPSAKSDESKYRVITELMAHGYIPYAAVTKSSGPDLLIFSQEGEVLKIKVKTGHYHEKNGEVYEPSKIDKGQFDYLAQALADKILFSPPLPGDSEEGKEGSIGEKKEEEKEGEKWDQKEGKNIEEDNH